MPKDKLERVTPPPVHGAIKNKQERLGSNNPPAVIAEFTSDEVRWLLDTTELQVTVGVNMLQAVHDNKLDPSHAALEKMVADVELLRSIRKKLQP